MNTTGWVIVVVVAVVVVVVLLAALAAFRRRRQRRQERAREEFGPEYERAAEERGSGSAAERELRERREEVESRLRPLPDESRRRYREQWEEVERGFVDNPVASLQMADRLVSDVLGERNLPASEGEEAARSLGVIDPHAAEDYREARRLREAAGSSGGDSQTEELRQAIRRYRLVYERLLER
ncbi:putative secreted protein [Rubrobacter xylanophilus DSM 9941]|uniref:Putative secreted protein n=1 Tax=Rubrobacter xylanophilus (strain DSM 9941 / JCM 11954 / NBRC 16129 / PRD-1) TaxID=266117 RepID=Q1AS90_RUBXD|nr:putative secreted protein [Rubrobacter xylanophilus]ABG05738.1 putative secreted protein [Rubrobacter xylanophilus DSM 9941]